MSRRWAHAPRLKGAASERPWLLPYEVRVLIFKCQQFRYFLEVCVGQTEHSHKPDSALGATTVSLLASLNPRWRMARLRWALRKGWGLGGLGILWDQCPGGQLQVTCGRPGLLEWPRRQC